MRIDANITLPQVATPTIPLTLPDVERRVAKLGYHGLCKYLYVSFSEFIPMMTASVVKFAYMHRNVTMRDMDQRIKEAKTVKAFTYIPGFAAAIVLVSYTSFSPPLTIAVSVLTAILGHIASHSVFLYLADAGAGNILKIEELRDLFNKYKTMPVEKVSAALSEEIDGFLKDADKMKDIILHPKKYINGRELREMYIKNLELLYAFSNIDTKFDTRDKLLKFLADVYKNIDSLHLQNAYMLHFKTLDRKQFTETSSNLFKILEFNSKVNIEKIRRIKSSRDGKDNKELIANQQKLFYLQILNGNKNRQRAKGQPSYSAAMFSEIAERRVYGEFAAQLFLREYVAVHKRFPERLVRKFLSKSECAAFFKFLDQAPKLSEILEYISENKLPYELGCYMIAAEQNEEDIYAVFKSEDFDAKFRLYSLKTLAKTNYITEEYLMFSINEDKALTNVVFEAIFSKHKDAFSTMSSKISKIKKESKKESVITDEDIESLRHAADAIVKGKTFTDKKNPFSNNINIELLITALVLLASNFNDVDIFKSLKGMPNIMSFNDGDNHEIFKDHHGLLLLQDVKKEDYANTEKLIDDLESFIVNKENAKLRYKDTIPQMKDLQ